MPYTNYGSAVRPSSARRLMFALLFCCPLSATGQEVPPTGTGAADIAGISESARKLYAERQWMDEVFWGPEILAQKFESRFVHLWDQLLRRDDRFQVLATFPFESLVLPRATSNESLDLQIRRTRFTAGGESISPEQWRRRLSQYETAGYQIVHTEWHHEDFQPPRKGLGARSKVRMVVHAARDEPAHRVIIRALLGVEWSLTPGHDGNPVPGKIIVEGMEVLDRHSPPVFSEVFRVKGTEAYPRLLPLLVYDLDGDGLSEIVLAGANMAIRNRGSAKFEVDRLLSEEHSIYDGAVFADFTGDGNVDFVAVDTAGFPLLFAGDSRGRFTEPGHRMANTHLGQPKVFTAGDIDSDGDLDLFIANYKYPYRQGQVPTPYYDANDGYPAYLLRNDGNGNFSDITEQAGLGPKRFRRTFSTSLVDLDDDRDMDLLVVSDYAGLDVYLNDGSGNLADVSNQLNGERHFFGMGHTFGDYDLDGMLDFYIIGMSSTTARRLELLGLSRPDKPDHNALRPRMGYGNRMFLRRNGKFVQAPFNDSVARTGWSWGATSFDFDNDGDKDIFVANGHVSGRSSKDYCSTFWRHDIYVNGSKPDPARDLLFQVVSKDLREANISWNGYEHKALMMNQRGDNFVNVAFLMGTAFEYDARAAVSADLDADGRVDLLVVEFKSHGVENGRDKKEYILHVYRNAMDDAGHWIGVRLPEQGLGWSPIGATVTIKSKAGSQTAQIVTGDSFSAQHPATVHFGLGGGTEVDAIEVRWPNGAVQHIQRPAVDRYHQISAPPAS